MIIKIGQGYPDVRVLAVVPVAARRDVRAVHGEVLQDVLTRPVRRFVLAQAVANPDSTEVGGPDPWAPGSDELRDSGPRIHGPRRGPLSNPAALPATEASVTPTLPPAPEVAAPRGRVLIVEDNPVNQMLARRFLARAGFASGLARDGKEGLEALRGDRWDAVLMDCQMPVMDGIEATTHIRRGEVGTGAHIPIIAMTAHAMEEDRRRAMEAGMDAYLTKPIQPQEMERVLNDLIFGGSDGGTPSLSEP